MYSLIESAKLNHLKLFEYMEHLLENLPQEDILDETTLEKYLPWSDKLPEALRSYEVEYKDLKICE